MFVGIEGLPYVCSFLLYCDSIMLENVKVCINGYERITFQGCIFHWYRSFLIARLKQKLAMLTFYCDTFVKSLVKDNVNVMDVYVPVFKRLTCITLLKMNSLHNVVCNACCLHR